MKKLLTFVCLFCASSVALLAQTQGVTQCGTPTGQPSFPLQSFKEMPDPAKPVPAQWTSITSANASWGSTDTRYALHKVPLQRIQRSVTVEGWRGEKVNAQAVVWTKAPLNDLHFSFSQFSDGKGHTLPAESLKGGFVRYVITDELNLDGRGGCGFRPNHTKFDSSLVADCIDSQARTLSLDKMSTRPIWVSCRIPASIAPGIYKGNLIVKSGDTEIASLSLSIKALDRILPTPDRWRYHLDLWQNPYAVARYYQVPVWSQAHLDAMKPLMRMLADAGQKVITASIMHKPWDAQTQDYYESMVTWTKKLDGTWTFDYAVFDRWVQFMMDLGIDQQINCYSMIPWKLSFQYFDQATNRMATIQTAPDKAEYKEMWTAMLTSFAKHLREKGWFDRCTIAMDERPMDVMKQALAIIRKADPAFKVTLAGNFHKELEGKLYDYCIAIGQNYPEEVKAHRKEKGQVTTCYTCCTEAFPNTYTFSAPAEAAWISYYSAKNHLDGYLRWSYNSWPKEPLLDSRYSRFAAGDTYLVYPGARSSIRFEKLIEGIQAHEKINILRREFTERKQHSKLRSLEKLLSGFKLLDLPQVPASKTVNRVRTAINKM